MIKNLENFLNEALWFRARICVLPLSINKYTSRLSKSQNFLYLIKYKNILIFIICNMYH
jgi:hypothetical protein